MKRKALTIFKKGLLCLIALVMLYVQAGLVRAESTAEESEATASLPKKHLLIGTNAGGSQNLNANSDDARARNAKIQALHEQAGSLMQTLLFLEDRDQPSVRVSYIAGGREQAGDTLSWQTIPSFLSGCQAVILSPGEDLLYFLKNAAAAAKERNLVYWFDRLSAPEIPNKSTAKQYYDALNNLLENSDTDVYLAFAADDRGRLAQFESQVVSQVFYSNRLHLLTYDTQSLFDNLAALTSQDRGALYLEALEERVSEKSAAVRLYTYSYQPASGAGYMVYIQSDEAIKGIRVRRAEANAAQEGSEGSAEAPAEAAPVSVETVRLDKEAFVLFPSDAQADLYAIQVTYASENAAASASSYLLPTWKPAVQMEIVTQDRYSENWQVTLSAALAGLAHEDLDVKAYVEYASLSPRTPLTALEMPQPGAGNEAPASLTPPEETGENSSEADPPEETSEAAPTDIPVEETAIAEEISDASGTPAEGGAEEAPAAEGEVTDETTEAEEPTENRPAAPSDETQAEAEETIPLNTRIALSEAQLGQTQVLDDGTLLWNMTLPPLSIGQGKLTFSLYVKNPDASIMKRPGQPLASVVSEEFSVENRAPAALAESAWKTLYYAVPGCEDRSLSLPLHTFFSDPDQGQRLTYCLHIDGQDYSPFGAFSVEGDALIVQPDPSGSISPVQVRAYDPYGEYAEITLSISEYALEELLQTLSFVPEPVEETKLGVPTALKWRLSADSFPYYADAQLQYPELPALKEALQVSFAVTKDGAAISPDDVLENWSLTADENGDLLLEAQVTASDVTREIHLTPQGVFQNGNASVPLNHLFPSSETSIVTNNTAPQVRDGVEKEGTAAGFVMDAPWAHASLSVPVNGEAGFRLSDLFTDHETDSRYLTYCVLTDSAAVRLSTEKAAVAFEKTDGSAVAGREGWYAAEISWDQTFDVFSLEMTEAGKAQVEIYARDAEFPYQDHISVQISGTSYFGRFLLIALIALVVLGAVTAELIVLHEKRRPSFQPYRIEVADARFPQINGRQNLKYYGKKNVDFLTLLIAVGIPPMASIDSAVLAGIELKPLKKELFQLVLSEDAPKAVRVEYEGGAQPEKNILFSLGQTVCIRSLSGPDGIVFRLSRENQDAFM